MWSKSYSIITISVIGILLIPIIGMQYSDEIQWNVLDFILAGIILSVTGLILEFIHRKVKRKGYKVLLTFLILLILLFVWVELAIGIF